MSNISAISFSIGERYCCTSSNVIDNTIINRKGVRNIWALFLTPYIFNIKNNYSSKAEINIAFTSQSWTSPGTYTWVAPFTGTITVCVIGGGGGGTTRYSNDEWVGQATGGSAGSPNGRSGGRTANNSNGNSASGGQGFSLSKTISNGSYGSGGSAKDESYHDTCAGGGSGGCNIQSISVISGTSYTIIVGSGGSGLKASHGIANAGNSGAVGIWKE